MIKVTSACTLNIIFNIFKLIQFIYLLGQFRYIFITNAFKILCVAEQSLKALKSQQHEQNGDTPKTGNCFVQCSVNLR